MHFLYGAVHLGARNGNSGRMWRERLAARSESGGAFSLWNEGLYFYFQPWSSQQATDMVGSLYQSAAPSVGNDEPP
jgi:hypothetical protein